jgi:4-hydroxybenzoate polyprenyltransferase
MTLGFFSRRYARVIRHFSAVRASEVLLLQASPLLGIFFGGIKPHWVVLGRIALLFIGSVALTAHIFVFNDWAGQSGDARDPRRAAQFFGRRAISSREVAHLAVALLVVSMLAMALVGVSAVLFGAGIAGLSILYSASCTFGKGKPILASLLHVIGGAFHFLLGYSVGHGADASGLAIALFFGLVFAGGHLNQEVRDYDADRCNRIRTTAVVFGRRCAFVASLVLFTGAYLLLIVLVLRGVLARPLIWAALLWPWHLFCSVHALRGEIGFEAAMWMQRRYRLEFALLGLAMMLTTPPVIDLVRRAHQPTRPDTRQTVAASKAPRA